MALMRRERGRRVELAVVDARGRSAERRRLLLRLGDQRIGIRSGADRGLLLVFVLFDPVDSGRCFPLRQSESPDADFECVPS